MSNLIVVAGPQAVGKMTVAEELQRRLGYRLMVNHDTIDLSAKLFEFNTPAQWSVNRAFRDSVFNTAVYYNIDLIFTYVCDFSLPWDKMYMMDLCEKFVDSGGQFYFVELSAALDERLRRNKTPHRLERKPMKRDIESSRANLLSDWEQRQLNSKDGEKWFEHHLKIDNTHLEPEKVAEQITSYFALL